MPESHVAVVLSGLRDNFLPYKFLVKDWKKRGLTAVVPQMHWHSSENLNGKMFRLNALGRVLKEKYDLVSWVGFSSGGSLALNLFLSNPERYYKAVTVCSRLVVGNRDDFLKRTKTSQSFAESVEDLQWRLTGNIAYNPRWMCFYTKRDEIVPVNTSTINQAQKKELIAPGHFLSIGVAMLGNSVTDFLRG